MEEIICDLCEHEIIAHVKNSNTQFFKIGASGRLMELISTREQPSVISENEDISYHCSNPDCGQVIGSPEDLKFYTANSDPDEFRLFKQLDILQDVIEELCRLQLQTDSINASTVISNTLKNLPQNLPLIIEMKRKMVEGDFVEKVDLRNLLK